MLRRKDFPRGHRESARESWLRDFGIFMRTIKGFIYNSSVFKSLVVLRYSAKLSLRQSCKGRVMLPKNTMAWVLLVNIVIPDISTWSKRAAILRNPVQSFYHPDDHHLFHFLGLLRLGRRTKPNSSKRTVFAHNSIHLIDPRCIRSIAANTREPRVTTCKKKVYISRVYARHRGERMFAWFPQSPRGCARLKHMRESGARNALHDGPSFSLSGVCFYFVQRTSEEISWCVQAFLTAWWFLNFRWLC